LRNSGYIDNEQQIAAGIILTTIFVIYQVYLIYPSPAERGSVEPGRILIEKYLDGLVERYYECLESLSPDAAEVPDVRANLMLPTKKWKGSRESFLKIYYVAPGSLYSNPELSLEWKPGVGACGWAWENGHRCPYDSKQKELKIPDGSLSESQKIAVADINSTLSVPLWNDGKIVGVLNLDSKRNVDETFLNHPEVYTLAIRCAQDLAPHCNFSRGRGRHKEDLIMPIKPATEKSPAIIELSKEEEAKIAEISPDFFLNAPRSPKRPKLGDKSIKSLGDLIREVTK